MDNKEQLIEKLNREFEDFKKQQLEQDKESIFNNSVEVAVKYFIYSYLSERAELKDYQIDALLESEEDKILHYFYTTYMSEKDVFDTSEIFEEYIDGLLDEIVEQQEEQE